MKSKKWIGLAVIIIGALALVALGYRNYQHGRIFPSTDNAYVGGDVFAVAPRIPGTLVAVPMQENTRVRKGDLLARLDDADLKVAVAKAEAELAKAEALLSLDEAQIAGAEAQLTAARSEAAQTQADLRRFTTLQERGSAPARQSEEAATAAQIAAAKVNAAEKALTASQAKLDVDRKSVAKARTGLANAQLQMTYTTIMAPEDGFVADKSATMGQVVGAGQPLCRIVPLDAEHIWVDANFKETQLHRIRPGQPVTLKVDAIADHEFQGEVDSFAPGTGSAFSLLPPENASGNWVKIVQRLPVRISLDRDDPLIHRLRLGLSVEVVVDTRQLESD